MACTNVFLGILRGLIKQKGQTNNTIRLFYEPRAKESHRSAKNHHKVEIFRLLMWFLNSCLIFASSLGPGISQLSRSGNLKVRLQDALLVLAGHKPHSFLYSIISGHKTTHSCQCGHLKIPGPIFFPSNL